MKTFLVSSLSLVLVCLIPGLALARTDSGAEASPYPHSLPATDATGDSELTTLFAQNNNYAGNSFDLIGVDSLTVVGWECNLGPDAPSYTVHVYWRDGTADGFETSTAGWNELGSVVVVGAGVDQPTHIDIGGLEILTGETKGIIITAEEAVAGVGGFYYTNGGPNTYTNDTVTIYTLRGLAVGWPPSGTFAYRAWNGTVHYNYGVALDRSTWGSIKANF